MWYVRGILRMTLLGFFFSVVPCAGVDARKSKPNFCVQHNGFFLFGCPLRWRRCAKIKTELLRTA
jgi:hypothetical protein